MGRYYDEADEANYTGIPFLLVDLVVMVLYNQIEPWTK